LQQDGSHCCAVTHERSQTINDPFQLIVCECSTIFGQQIFFPQMNPQCLARDPEHCRYFGLGVSELKEGVDPCGGQDIFWSALEPGISEADLVGRHIIEVIALAVHSIFIPNHQYIQSAFCLLEYSLCKLQQTFHFTHYLLSFLLCSTGKCWVLTVQMSAAKNSGQFRVLVATASSFRVCSPDASLTLSSH